MEPENCHLRLTSSLHTRPKHVYMYMHIYTHEEFRPDIARRADIYLVYLGLSREVSKAGVTPWLRFGVNCMPDLSGIWNQGSADSEAKPADQRPRVSSHVAQLPPSMATA